VLALVATLAFTAGVDRWGRELISRESSVQDLVLSVHDTIDRDGRTVLLHHAPTFTLDDWREAKGIPYVVDAVLTASDRVPIRGPKRTRDVLVTASTANLPDFSEVDVEIGRYFTDAELTREIPVVVIGYRLAEELAAPRNVEWLINKDVRVGDHIRRVVGILAPRPEEVDLTAFIPVTRKAGMPAMATVAPRSVLRLKAARVEDVAAARVATLDWIARRFARDREAIDLRIGLERLERTEQAMLLTRLIFGLLVGLLLAVGGIGIMNIQLAAVAERTREIGIRKSLGARNRDVLVHFLTESLVIAGLGAVLGAACGGALAIGATAVFRQATGAGITPIFTSTTVGWVLAAALAVGIGFGTYPARLASRLTPIEAIQRD
jgi:putative ABC transport system permease protein